MSQRAQLLLFLALRVSPVAWMFDTEEDVLRMAKATADVTHNHPEGVNGAQAIAVVPVVRSHPDMIAVEAPPDG